MPGRAARGHGLASVFFGLGCITLLAVTFWSGVLTGRYWARQSPGTPPAASRGSGREPSASPRPGLSTPRFTYYEELTAPLRPLPQATEPPGASAGRAEPVARAERTVVRTVSEPTPGRRDAFGEAFTIQVGAYRSRTQAEALRARLLAAGYQAYISETERSGGARHRVRVGAFSTRDRADETALRLRRERVPTYVVPR